MRGTWRRFDAPGLRRALGTLAALTAVAVVLACSGPAEPAPAPGPTEERPAVQARSVQVVAHQDDDILFMNPDLSADVRAGQPTTTVFLTAGEADVPDRAEYAANRQAGARAAYARMAGVADDWRAEALPVGDRQVELYTLKARPDVQLVFVNLPEDADPLPRGGRGTLTRLWHDRTNEQQVESVVPARAAVPRAFTYNRAAVVDVLTGLLDRFHPTVVRVQDPQPDPRYTTNWKPFHDHPDHVMTARFAEEAVRRHGAGGQQPRFVKLNYRDYNVADTPVNLGPDQRRDKAEVFADYVRHDRLAFTTGIYAAWQGRMRYRWSRGHSWVGRNADGRLQAFAVLGLGVLSWRQREDGRWDAPSALPDAGGPLAPWLSTATGQDGRLRVFGRRLDTHEIVTLAQSEPNGAWAPTWTSLGNPNAQTGQTQQRDIGVPTAFTDADGRVTVVVRNGGGGVSARVLEERDRWLEWDDLGGSDVQDGLAAAVDRDGRAQVFGHTRGGIAHWAQQRRGERMRLRPKLGDGPVPAGPPAVARRQDGRLAVVYQAADSLELVSFLEQADGQQWRRAAASAPTAGSGCAPAVVAGRDGLRVYLRGSSGRVDTTTLSSADGSPKGTEAVDRAIVDCPAAATDRNGGPVMLGIGPDGQLVTDQRHNNR
ncbi:GlcNAc-PI de-N-acetylase [Streptoalloteichus tenebrarius]|uniref:GlcNAc-PI de-N-acetylase n=1 Tax=Streptoalloteichus tenebrarius (strain ATCC 17920 / DSM 40477 / JCM 4838 / CBS 697.72 / NBRC 16177 / NCIMB 11028 / NRRL B-12390 / A12253. 1 / ISP 5477) TaxID=1933 RepID=A0ABT1HRG3_STRSD|nr:PIG-L family deacetylase [Streptoalloteichus tenebrarius]MCP2258114.1 GlcNAc-PI de-N-acetylase [Streptoalloteichus tenebrarius]